MKRSFVYIGTMFAGIALTVVSGCVADHAYDVDNIRNIDASLTLFNDGITLPLGQTEPVSLSSILNMSKARGLDSLLVADSLTGDYSLEARGSRDLQEVISKMQLDKLKNIDGSSFSKKLEYVIGEFNPSQFTIEGKQFSWDSQEFPVFSPDKIPVPSFQFPDRVIAAELYKYVPSDMDLGKRIDDVAYSEKIIAIDQIRQVTDAMTDAQIAAAFQTVLNMLGLDTYRIQDYQQKIHKTLDLGENASKISDIKDFKLRKGSAIKLSLAVENAPLTSGTVTPDIDIDMSSLFRLSGADALTGKLNLSSMIMTSENGWRTSREFEIIGLTDGFPSYGNGQLALDGIVSMGGAVRISGASSNRSLINSLAGRDMKISVEASCDGVILETMEIIVGSGVDYELPECEMPLEIDCDLPEGVKSVDRIYFDGNGKFEVSIYAKGLDNLISADGTKHLGIYPRIVITLPEDLEIAEAVNHKIEIEGADLFDGPIHSTFTLVSLKPDNVGGKLTYKGKMSAKAYAVATGTVSSKYLPKLPEEDVVVTVKAGCMPKLGNFDVTLDEQKISRSVSEVQEFSFDMEGMGDFGTFRLGLEGNPKATLSFNFPQTSEVAFVADKLVISIPEMMVVDGSSIPGFDAVKNTVTLNGPLPKEIVLPVKYLRVTPESGEEGKTVVKGVCSVEGGISVDKFNVSATTFNELSGKKVNVSAVLSSMKASSIVLEGDFAKSLDYDVKDIVILDSGTVSALPKEIREIDDISLDGVNAIIEFTVSGLPDMVGEFFLSNTTITMPQFIIGENGTNVLTLDDRIPVHNAQTVRQCVGISDIRNVRLAGMTELKGDVLIRSKLVSHRPEVDVSTLKSKIDVDMHVGVGNGTAASSPGKIVVDKATVKADYVYEDVQLVSLGQIPEAFQADSVNLALSPNLYLDLTTNFGAPVKGDFLITPVIKGQPLEDETVHISGVSLPYSTDCSTLTNRYAIGLNPFEEPDVTVLRTDLSGLVKRIPDSLRLAVKVMVDPAENCVIYSDAEYNCSMKYKFSVPMKLSDKFELYLNPTVAIDSGTNEALKLATVRLKGTCLTSLPLGVDCNIKLLDADGKEIAFNKPASLRILPSPDGVKVAAQSFDVILDIADKENLHAAKILFAMSMLSSKDICVNRDQTIQLTDLKIQLPDGVTFNFNRGEE